MFIPDPASGFFCHPGSRGQAKKHQIPDTDPQHSFFYNSSMTEQKMQTVNQCFRSGSANFGRLDPDLHWECGSGSRRAEMTEQSEEISCLEVLDVLF
jgi:hypothetical protein